MITIRVASLTEAQVNAVVLPVTDGLVAHAEFRSADADLACRNFAIPANVFQPIGSPTFETDGVTVDSSNYLLGWSDSATFTRYVIGRAVSPVDPASGVAHGWIGNWVSGNGGTMLYSPPVSSLWRLQLFGLGDTPNAVAGEIGTSFLMSCRMSATQGRAARVTAPADANQRTLTAYTPPSPARLVRVGGLSNYLPVKVQMVTAYSRNLTDDEDALMVNALRARALAKFGLSV